MNIILISFRLLKIKKLENIIYMLWKIRADASENCRKLRLILAIKLIFKNKIIQFAEIWGNSEIQQQFFLKENYLPLNYCNFLII